VATTVVETTEEASVPVVVLAATTAAVVALGGPVVVVWAREQEEASEASGATVAGSEAVAAVEDLIHHTAARISAIMEVVGEGMVGSGRPEVLAVVEGLRELAGPEVTVEEQEAEVAVVSEDTGKRAVCNTMLYKKTLILCEYTPQFCRMD